MKHKHLLAAGMAAVAIVLAAVAFITGCSGQSSAPTVTVGSKNFTEQIIIGEIMAAMIDAHTDLEVERRLNLGGTMICHRALTRGEVDVYAEYTGTALTAILKQPVIADPDRAYDVVKEAYEATFGCTWLAPFGFNNTYTLTVRGDVAEQHELRSISDLESLASDLTAGFTAEFAVREDGYPGLRQAYGFGFGETKDMDPGLMYKAIARGDVDVICAFATDGRIAAYDLATLDDDKAFFPPYYAAPVVRMDTLAAHPDLRRALEPLAGLLGDDTMRKLNLEVDENKREPDDVARDFLVSHQLIPAPENN